MLYSDLRDCIKEFIDEHGPAQWFKQTTTILAMIYSIGHDLMKEQEQRKEVLASTKPENEKAEQSPQTQPNKED